MPRAHSQRPHGGLEGAHYTPHPFLTRKRPTFLAFNSRRDGWVSLGGDSAPFGDSLKLAEVWQGEGATRSSA